MATVPSPDNWAAGEIPTAQKLNKNIRDAVNFLLAPPECRLARKNTQQTGLTGGALISFDATLLDNDGMSNIAAAPTKITIVTPGTYNVKVNAQLVNGANQANGVWMQMIVRKNGSNGVSTFVMPQFGTGVGAGMCLNADVNCVAGDYFEIVCNANGGGFTANNTGDGVVLSARWIGN